jgi:small conductance mechanosensitive channel
MASRWEELLRDWQGDWAQWLRHGAPRLIAILLVTFVLLKLLGFTTRKVIQLSKSKALRTDAHLQQIRTVVGVARSIGVFAIIFIAFMQALPLFDIDIKPLLASAGIAGLAIGFGAQTLVKDVINGFFILVENQFEVGDVITVRASGVTGAVEEISMRRTTLRDGDGTLHVVPNSAIQVVSNMTRDWSQVILHVTADYSEDSDRVVQVLRDVAKAFYNDPGFRDNIVSEPEVPGIERVTGQEVDYLILVKVRAGQRDAVARELRRRVKTAFEQNKIKAVVPAQMYYGQSPGTAK